ncbi:MAG TPA: DUF1015 domain-containing protein [Fimbriimonas sp.]
MAAIRPFRALRFSADAGSLNALVAPPYDVLSPAEREDYAARSPHNIVHLTLPEQHPDDRSKYVKYARSAARLAEWRREGTLALEESPSIYRYTQSFWLPGIEEAFVRTSLVTLIKVEPYEKGIVLPHEQTFPKHKEDRLRILEATRAHLECIYGLFEDPSGEVLKALREAPAGSAAEVEMDGVQNELEPITDAAAVARLVGLLADKKVWIADGHHRYETAWAFRQSVGEKDGEVPEDYMMMALSSMSDPGLVLLPTHRMLKGFPLSRQQTVARLEELFHAEEHNSRRIVDLIAGAHARGVRAFGAVFPGGISYLLTPKDEAELLSRNNYEGSDDLKKLDVTLLHNVILENLLGVKGLDSVSYTRDPHEAIREADQGGIDVAFLMNPPSVGDMKRIAMGGEKMPQKSTYYYPKLTSGLLLWSLNDF